MHGDEPLLLSHSKPEAPRAYMSRQTMTEQRGQRVFNAELYGRFGGRDCDRIQHSCNPRCRPTLPACGAREYRAALSRSPPKASAAHQAASRGRPRVAADAGEGPPPPPEKTQRGLCLRVPSPLGCGRCPRCAQGGSPRRLRGVRIERCRMPCYGGSGPGPPCAGQNVPHLST
jgi:hypothetical protein